MIPMGPFYLSLVYDSMIKDIDATKTFKLYVCELSPRSESFLVLMFYYSLPGNISFVSESAKTTQADLIPNPMHLTGNFHSTEGGQAPLSGQLQHPQVQDLEGESSSQNQQSG